MLFNSIEFALFLPLVFLLYWFVFNRNWRWQNLLVVIVSYVFYGWWDWKFLIMIAITSFCSWLCGICMGEKKSQLVPDKRYVNWRWYLMLANVVLNLGILGFFKYYNFFVDSFVQAFGVFGFQFHLQSLKIILPVGISFYTFQALSYTIDVYHGDIRPTKDIIAFFAFISFFPQLVAGPIERATNLLPQFLRARSFSYPQAVDGCRQMLWGFFKKVVVADNCALYVDRIFNDYQSSPASSLVVAAILFAFQIYGDFSGYSDIAIGCSKLFGISLMQNFAYPYFSRDIAEFWRRWHISLSTWFRDYVYIPLGGSRVGLAKQIRNVFVIFLLSGFWHGANWTFLIWGGLHALLFLPLLLAKKNRRHTKIIAENVFLPKFSEMLQLICTFAIVVIAWIPFRAPDITSAWAIISNIITLKNGIHFPNVGRLTLLYTAPYIALMLGIEWINRRFSHGLMRLPSNPYLRYGIYWFLMLLVFINSSNQHSFIYFQF